MIGRFPARRVRRMRAHQWVRSLVCETQLGPSDLIWPVFVCEGVDRREPVVSMPGVERISIDLVVDAAQRAVDAGIPAIMIFPDVDPSLRDENATGALKSDGLVARAVGAVKKHDLPLGVMVDVALDPYTSHGHDGLLVDGRVDNDRTVSILIQQARMFADSGADVLAPSDMMDGRVGAIRDHLESRGHTDVMIASYAVKYASSLYGPFRDAIHSGICLQGDKKTYQMDVGNAREAEVEVALDVEEGADFVIVKPALYHLDIIRRLSVICPIPVLAYQVSGEYSQIMAAGECGWVDAQRAMMEALIAMKRAGASGILTYSAHRIARILSEK